MNDHANYGGKRNQHLLCMILPCIFNILKTMARIMLRELRQICERLEGAAKQGGMVDEKQSTTTKSQVWQLVNMETQFTSGSISIKLYVVRCPWNFCDMTWLCDFELHLLSFTAVRANSNAYFAGAVQYNSNLTTFVCLNSLTEKKFGKPVMSKRRRNCYYSKLGPLF